MANLNYRSSDNGKQKHHDPSASLAGGEETSRSMRASVERFRALLSVTLDVFYRMNADWTEMCYLRGHEFIVDTQEPSQSWFDNYIPPDDQPHVMEAIHAAIRSKTVFELEHRVMRVDGTIGWAFSRAIPMFDGNGGLSIAARPVSSFRMQTI